MHEFSKWCVSADESRQVIHQCLGFSATLHGLLTIEHNYSFANQSLRYSAVATHAMFLVKTYRLQQRKQVAQHSDGQIRNSISRATARIYNLGYESVLFGTNFTTVCRILHGNGVAKGVKLRMYVSGTAPRLKPSSIALDILAAANTR